MRIDLAIYSKDYRSGTRWNMEGKTGGEPLCVVFLTMLSKYLALVFANEHSIPVIPFGEGSGVVGGAYDIWRYHC